MCDQTNLPRHSRLHEEKPVDRFFKVRNILNIIFLIGAVIGVAAYYLYDHTVGIIIILASMVFKMVECCLRFSKK